MQLTNILSFGLLSLSAVSAAPNPTTPDDSQITLPPNFDYRHDYGELQDGPYLTEPIPAGRPIGSRFGPATNAQQLQTFDYDGVVDRSDFDRLFNVAGYLLPSQYEVPSFLLFYYCVMANVSHVDSSKKYSLCWMLQTAGISNHVTSSFIIMHMSTKDT